MGSWFITSHSKFAARENTPAPNNFGFLKISTSARDNVPSSNPATLTFAVPGEKFTSASARINALSKTLRVEETRYGGAVGVFVVLLGAVAQGEEPGEFSDTTSGDVSGTQGACVAPVAVTAVSAVSAVTAVTAVSPRAESPITAPVSDSEPFHSTHVSPPPPPCVAACSASASSASSSKRSTKIRIPPRSRNAADACEA